MWNGPARAIPALAAEAFDRTLDEQWRRTSYSGITAGTHDARVGSEPEEDVLDDEGGVGAGFVDRSRRRRRRRRGCATSRCSLADLPGGVHVGTFIHRVLETTDFAAVSLETELRGPDRIRTGLAPDRPG